MTDRQLYVLEIAIMTISSIVAIALGFWGVYLGQRALTMTAESESLQVRPILTVELNPAGPSMKIYNLGFGPAEIVHYSLGFLTEDGTPVIFDSDRADSGGDFFDFFGLEGINDGLGADHLVKSFDPLGVWGVDEQVDLLTVPGRLKMPEGWRATWEAKVDQVIETVSYCVVYISIDGFEQFTGSSPDACDGPDPANARYYDGP